MLTNVSSQNVRQDFLQSFQVANCDVESLLAFGEERLNCCFLLEDFKGVLEKPVRKGNWMYQEYDPDSITLHPKAYLNLNEVQKAGFPLMQIIYGYQIGTTAEAKAQPKPEIIKPRIQISQGVAKTAIAIGTGALMLTGVVAMVVAQGFLTALSAIDPKLIVVLDTGANERDLPWICLMSWDEEPDNS